jgi:hypothetical protein
MYLIIIGLMGENNIVFLPPFSLEGGVHPNLSVDD